MLVRLALLLTFGLAQPLQSQQSDYLVVVNQANPVGSLTRSQVSSLFLRKVTKWPDGTPVHAIDLPISSVVRTAFSREIHGKSVASISAYWQQQIFSGREVPPPEKSESEVVDFLRGDPGGIGYLPPSAGPPPAGLKTIQVLP